MQGLKTYSATRYDKVKYLISICKLLITYKLMLSKNVVNILCEFTVSRNPQIEEWPGMIDSFKMFHIDMKGQWVNKIAAQDYLSYKFMFIITS